MPEKVTRRQYPPELKAEALWMYDNGWSAVDVAEDLQLASPQLVWNWANVRRDGKLTLPDFTPSPILLAKTHERNGTTPANTITEANAVTDEPSADLVPTNGAVATASPAITPEVVPASQLVETQGRLRQALEELASTQRALTEAVAVSEGLRRDARDAEEVAAQELAAEQARTRRAQNDANTWKAALLVELRGDSA